MTRHNDALAIARHIVMGMPLPEPNLEPPLRAAVTLNRIDTALRNLLEQMEDETASRDALGDEDQPLAGFCDQLSDALRLLERWKREELVEVLR